MGRIKLVRKKHTAVYFTLEELKQISKKARSNVLTVSQFVRKITVDALGLNGEEKT